MKVATLNTAYHWDCDECGQENFVRGVVREMSPEDREACYRQFNELDDWSDLPDDWEMSQFVSIPNTVRCSNCETEFLTEED